MSVPQPPRVCLIGAGSSGMPVVKALRDRGIPFDCFEKSDQVGGNWTYKNKNGMSACYESLHINTTVEIMEYADYPMPTTLPPYPSHYQIKRYFDDYIDHFKLRELIQFNTEVTKAEQLPDGRWRIELDNGEHKEYDKLIVANGHHWDPRWPDPRFPGQFNGVEIHSHSYANPTDPIDMQGKRVVIVGMGNSAMDIASELSRIGCAEKVFLAARSGVWIMPKFIGGKAIAGKSNPHLPWWLQGAIFQPILKMTVGHPQDYGLPKPNHRFLQAHPTISQDIYGRIGSGDVTVKPNIAELKGDRVQFTDGSEEDADVIIYATGYKVSFPFFDSEFLSAPDNELPLWQQLIKPDLEHLYFVGLLQPIGAMMPVAEKQARLIAAHLVGDITLPSRQEMQKDIERNLRKIKRRYVNSPRHTMQVDVAPYMLTLDKIMARGRKQKKRSAA